MEQNMSNIIGLDVTGSLKIYDPKNGQVFVDKKNAIHYENMSYAMALTLSNRGTGTIYQMAFGNGGASVDATGIITYLPPNASGQNAALYNQTYAKIVDDTLISNFSPLSNKMIVNHTTGKIYTDVLIQCLLDYEEPSGQAAFDNGTNTNSDYVFDEIGLLANNGIDADGNVTTKLLTHVIFHPIQKSLNRQIQIDYTIRIQTLTNMLTI
jgi:hypothetical protein